MPTWLHAPGCLTLCEWPHHHGYLSHKRPFWYRPYVYSCHLFLISSASVNSLPFLFFIIPILAWNIALMPPVFLKGSLVCCFPLFLCIVYLRRPSYLSLLFSRTFHSVGCIFTVLPCLSLLFPQLLVRPAQTITLPSCISFFFLAVVAICKNQSFSSRCIHVAAWVRISFPFRPG